MQVGTYDYEGLINSFLNQSSHYETTAEGRMSYNKNVLKRN